MGMTHEGWTKSVWPLNAGGPKTKRTEWTLEATGIVALYRQLLLGPLEKSTATSKQTPFRQ